MVRTEQLEATVEHIVYRTEDGRFAVLRATRARSPKGETITVVGDLGTVVVGETLRLVGRFSEHAQFGRQFRVETFSPVMPDTPEGIQRYLGSGLVEGIGQAMAKRLVKKFGARTLSVITQESERLRDVPGIGKKRASAITEALRARAAEAETMSFLHGLGLGPSVAQRILKKYSDQTVHQIRHDPYLVAEDVAGIGFRTADRIASALDIKNADPRRVAGATLHLVAKAVDEGHTFSTASELERGAKQLDVPPASVNSSIAQLVARGTLVEDRGAIYPPPLFRAEQNVARKLRTLASKNAMHRAEPSSDNIAQPAEPQLNSEQQQAVKDSLRRRALVLTGGPGTGKTTTVRTIVAAQKAAGRRVLLCAPTGRAAKRLQDATGHPASTIHRALEWNPMARTFRYDQTTPLDVEFILVDEASMLDIRLAESLLSAVGPSASLMLVGDVDQLPPVGPGQMLRDVIASGAVPVVRLHQVFRQAQESSIVRAAHSILQGEMPSATPASSRTERGGDLFIVRASEPKDIEIKLVRLLQRMHDSYGLDPIRDVQVLAPMRRGAAGTIHLNHVLQAALNASTVHQETATQNTPIEGSSSREGNRLRPGDKVMQIRNDYDRDVYNGDLGVVRRVEGGITYVMIDDREVQYREEHLDSLVLAYATTVHKVQGCEFPAVVVVMHRSHHILLSRALLYTAVTRAKRLVVLLGEPRAIARATRNASLQATNSRLRERLTEPAEDSLRPGT